VWQVGGLLNVAILGVGSASGVEFKEGPKKKGFLSLAWKAKTGRGRQSAAGKQAGFALFSIAKRGEDEGGARSAYCLLSVERLGDSGKAGREGKGRIREGGSIQRPRLDNGIGDKSRLGIGTEARKKALPPLRGRVR